MYKRQEAAAIKRKFWTSFGQYMKPIPSAWNEEVNWLNYHTGVKGIYFRLDADKNEAACGIEIGVKEEEMRKRLYEQFLVQRNYFESIAGHAWTWQPDVPDATGKTISRVAVWLNEVNVMNESDWPAIISFFKPNLIALDAFWANARDSFEMLWWQ